jgi:serine/threonine protein kinase
MQKRGTGRSKGGPDLQRDGGLAQREATAREAKRPARSSKDDVSLSDHADGALTLATLYDTGAFERMRLDVRIRLLADVAESLAGLHANQRLMDAQPYLGLMPSTVVIGLDGVARIDVRAAKKRELDTAYAAPEVLKADPRADHRADIYSLGIVAWEALAGERLGSKLLAPIGARPKAARRPQEARADRPAPVVLGGAMVARRREAFDVSTPSDDEPRIGTGNGSSGGGVSHQRIRVPFPTLPAEAAWAQSLGQIAVKALSADPNQRPQQTSVLLEEIEALDSHFATHHEIAEVVQGISSLSSLYTPEPGPPRTDNKCQPNAPRGMDSRRGLKGCTVEAPENVVICVQPPAAYHSLQPPAPAVVAVAAPKIVEAERVTPVHKPPRPRRQSMLAAYPRGVWLGVGLLWILTFGLLVGYFARAMLPQ